MIVGPGPAVARTGRPGRSALVEGDVADIGVQVDGSRVGGDLDPGGRGGEREVHLPDLGYYRERPAAQAGAADLAGVDGDLCPGRAPCKMTRPASPVTVRAVPGGSWIW